IAELPSATREQAFWPIQTHGSLEMSRNKATRSIPNVSGFPHAARLALTLALLAILAPPIASAASQEPPGGTAASMKAYTQTIPGTEVTFDLVPIPGGAFEMGSPSSEAKRNKDEDPQHTVQIATFWMGTKEVTWDEYEQFAFSLDIKKKKREGLDLTKQ